jgi:small ligand-binding sensory domain FIST
MLARPVDDRQTRLVLRIVSAASRDPDRDRAAAELARELARGLAGTLPRGVLFFATPHHGPAYDVFERAIARATGAPHVVGCSTRGIIGSGGEHGAGAAALALAGDLEVQRFYLPHLRGRAFEVGREIGRRAAALERDPRVILLMADSYNLAPDELLAGIDATTPGTAVIGGGATEDGSTGETAVVGRGTSSNNAAAGLVLGGVEARYAISRACLPVTPWRTITRAECNRVLEIEGRPALPVFLESLPASYRQNLAQILPAVLAGIAEPMQPETEPGYLVRRILGVDPRREALLVGDEVVAGTRFATVVRDADAARRSLEASVGEMLANSADLAGAICFEDVERGEALYGIPDVDFAYLQRQLGDLPFAGFFSSIQLAPMGGRNRFHQYAGVVVGLAAAGADATAVRTDRSFAS